MPHEMKLVRNAFFTYQVGTKKDGAETVVSRAFEQIFNYDGISVQVNGTYKRHGADAINVFGKKHILATRTNGKDVAAKASSIQAKRLNPMSILPARNAKYQKLKAALGTDTTTLAKYAKEPTKNVYGSKLPDPSIAGTFFLIDGLTANEVYAVFTTAIKANTMALNADTEIELTCGAGHLGQLEQGQPLDTTTYTKMKVKVFFDGTIYNVNHCAGPAM